MSFMGNMFQPQQVQVDDRPQESVQAMSALQNLFNQQMQGGFQRDMPGQVNSGSHDIRSFQPQYQNQWNSPNMLSMMGQLPGGRHDPFSSQMFGGQYGAGPGFGQMDALQGMQNLMNQNPMVNNQQIQQALSAAATGSPAFHPNSGQTLTQAAGDYSFDNAFGGDLANMLRGGQAFGGQFSDMSGFQNQLAGLQGGSDRSGIMAGLPQGSDLGAFQQLFGQLQGGPQTQNMAGLAGQAAGMQTGLGGTTQRMLDQLGQFKTPEGAQSAALFNQLSGQLPGILNPAGFDQTEMFQNARGIFDRDLEDQLAQIRSESSAMGLSPGASDREGRLAREAGHATAQFNVGQQQLAERAFENQQNRGLQGFSSAQGLGNLADVGERMGLQAQGMLAGAIPGLAQAEAMPFQQQMQALGMQGDFLGQQFGQDAQAHQLRQQMLNPALQAAQIPTQEGFQRAGMMNQLMGSQFGEQSSLLNPMMQGAQIPFNQQFGAHEAAAGRMAQQLPLAMQQGNMPLQTMMQMQSDAANRQMQALNPMLQAAGMGDQRLNQQFGMGQQMQQNEQGMLDRQMQEFARTQNAMLPFLMGMTDLPGTQTHFGPSTMSQLGGLAQGIGSMTNTFGNPFSAISGLFGGGQPSGHIPATPGAGWTQPPPGTGVLGTMQNNPSWNFSW